MEKPHITIEKGPLLCMKFMVSFGRNPIISTGDEKQLPIGSKWLSIKRGNGMVFKKQKDYAPILAKTD